MLSTKAASFQNGVWAVLRTLKMRRALGYFKRKDLYYFFTMPEE